MTKEKGSDNPSRSPSNLQDGADVVPKKPLIRYKRNPRVLCSNDIKEEVKSSENSGGFSDDDNRRVSSTSGFIKAAEDYRPEIVPFKKRASYMTLQDDHILDSSQSQLAARESGGKLSPFKSAGEEYCVEKETGDENLVEGGISTKIHDDGHSKTTGTTPQGGRDYNDIAPTVVGVGKQAHDTKQDTGGASDGCLPTDTAVEKSDGNNEADCHEQVQQVAMKDVVDGSVLNSLLGEEGQSKGGKKPVGYFVSLMMDDDVPDQLTEFEDNGGSNSCLLTDHTIETNNVGSGEAGDEEGQQASMEEGGYGNNSNHTPGGEEQGKGGKKRVEDMNDANTEGGHHEQEQLASMEDGSNNRPEGEEQRKEGKKPMEIDISAVIHDGGSSKSSKVPEDGNAADGEQVHPADPVTKPEGGGGKGKGITPALGGEAPCGIANASGSILAQEGSGRQGQQDPMAMIFGRRRRRSTYEQGVAAQEGGAAGDGSGEQARKKFNYGSDGIIGNSNSLGPNGGIGHDELPVQPPVQQATRKIRLFGFDISCEQEHHVPIIIRDGGRRGSNQAAGGAAGGGSRPRLMQPRPGIRLFGVDISGDQVQPAPTGNKDGGSSSSRLPGSDGGHGR